MSKEIDFARVERGYYHYVQRIMKETRNLDPFELTGKLDKQQGKVIHTKYVVSDGTKQMKGLGFNSSFESLGKTILLNHDIGRYLQAMLTGNFNDFILKNAYDRVTDHGELGRAILKKGQMTYQIPNTKVFHHGIELVVGEHVKGKLPPQLSRKVTNLAPFQQESAYEVFASSNDSLKSEILSLNMQILQDVDRLDIYHQILSGQWVPMTSTKAIAPEIFETFYQRQYLNMGELRAKDLWSANVGELVRLSFLFQLKLVSVAKAILAEDLIMKMKDLRSDPTVFTAFDDAQEYLKEVIANSPDGIYLDHSNVQMKKRW